LSSTTRFLLFSMPSMHLRSFFAVKELTHAVKASTHTVKKSTSHYSTPIYNPQGECAHTIAQNGSVQGSMAKQTSTPEPAPAHTNHFDGFKQQNLRE
jgi:hypothetical protein